MTDKMSIETQQALLQYWEAAEALRRSDTDEAAKEAIDLLNQSNAVLWMLKQDQNKLRRRVVIVDKKMREHAAATWDSSGRNRHSLMTTTNSISSLYDIGAHLELDKAVDAL